MVVRLGATSLVVSARKSANLLDRATSAAKPDYGPYGALSALMVAIGNRALLVKPASSATAPDASDLDSTVAQRTCFDGAPRSCHLGLVAVPVVTTAGVMYVTSEAEGRMG